MNKFIEGFFSFFCVIGIPILLLYGFLTWTKEAREFKKVQPIQVEAKLISINYLPSTKRSNFAPIFHGTNISWAYYSTGNHEKYTTSWDCGPYGNLTCDREDVYRYAKEKSILWIKTNHYKTEIVGIKK